MDRNRLTFIDIFRQFSLLVVMPAAVLLGIGVALVVIARDWRLVLFGYALFSVMLALLLAQVVPPEWALLQAIVGGLIAVMSFLSASQLRGRRPGGMSHETRWPQMASLSSFRLMAVMLAAVAFFVVRDSGATSALWGGLPQVNPLLRDALLWIAVIGVIGLALHDEPLHAGLSLLILMGGAQLFLFSLMQRRMLVGLLEALQLLLGLAIAYLTVSRGLATTDVADEPPTSGWGL